MQRRNFLISLIFTLFSSCKFLKNPFATEEPEPIDDPWKYGGEIEIMYVRVKEVVYPNYPDPTGYCANIRHPKYGGILSSPWVAAGDNKWIATVSLNCEPQPYFISTSDPKVGGQVGEKFYLRLKREGSSWTELTCIVPHPVVAGGQAAKFVFYNGQIQNPIPCS